MRTRAKGDLDGTQLGILVGGALRDFYDETSGSPF